MGEKKRKKKLVCIEIAEKKDERERRSRCKISCEMHMVNGINIFYKGNAITQELFK